MQCTRIVQCLNFLEKTMSIKQRIKFKTYRDRGTSPAVLRSSGPKQRPVKRVATTLGVSDGESAGRSVPANDMNKENEEKFYEMDRPRYEEQSEEEYLKHCERFFKGWDDDKVE